MGAIMGMFTLASLFFALIGGGISDRIGSRWAVGISVLIVAIAGALRAYAESAAHIMICMFTMGIGMAVFGPNTPKVLGMWFSPKQLATANGICVFGMGLAGVVAMGTAASFLSPIFGGWRNVMMVIGAFSVVTSLLWMILFKDVKIIEEQKKNQSIRENLKKVFRVKDIWLITLFYTFIMVSGIPVLALLPHSLAERGMTEAWAGALVSIYMCMSSIFKILGAIISDRVGKRKPFIFISAIVQGVCITIFGVSTGIPFITALFIGGAAVGTIPPIMMIIPVELKEIGPALSATAMGLIFMIGNTGGFLGPIVAGKLMDLTTAHWPGFLFMGIAGIIAAFCILPVRETGLKGNRNSIV
jgi:cyanate permease